MLYILTVLQDDPFFYFETLIDILFIVDMAFNFVTGGSHPPCCPLSLPNDEGSDRLDFVLTADARLQLM